MSFNLIGTELEKTDKLTQDKISNIDNEMEEPKVDDVEEDQASVLLKKNYDTSITSQKTYIVEREDKSKENVNEKVNASIKSTNKNNDIEKKEE